MSCHNIQGLPDDPPRFPDVLVTEFIANWADPRCGSWFGRMAELSPLTGYDPNSLIEISSEYMEELVHDVGVGGMQRSFFLFHFLSHCLRALIDRQRSTGPGETRSPMKCFTACFPLLSSFVWIEFTGQLASRMLSAMQSTARKMATKNF